MKDKNNSSNVKRNYWNNLLKQPTKKLNEIPPQEEVTFRLDNVLKLTDNYRIEIFQNATQIISTSPNPSTPGNNIRKENSIITFSENSKRNLKKILSKINFTFYPQAYLVTLTFHNIYPKAQNELKKMIDNFNKRLNRCVAELHYIWKLELQKRGAPHLHYIILLRRKPKYNERELLLRRIRNAWWSIIPEQTAQTFKHSVDIQEPKNKEHYFRYLLKYMDKTDDSDHVENLGRRWGRSTEIIMSALAEIKVDEDFYNNFRKRMFRLMRERMKLPDDIIDNYARNYSFEICITADEMLTEIAKLAAEMNRKYIIAQIQNSLKEIGFI